MDDNKMVLYWCSGCPYCFRALIALEEKGCKFDSKLLNFSKKQHKDKEVMSLNPRGQLPTFRHGKLVINDSGAICDYLEDAFKDQGTRLIPEDLMERALVNQRKYEAMNPFIKAGGGLWIYLKATKPEDIDEEDLKKRRANLRAELNIWEGYLRKNEDGPYIVGKSISLADVSFFPYLSLLVRMGLKLDKYPHLQSFYEQMTKRPAVQKAWPPHWKEEEAEDIIGEL